MHHNKCVIVFMTTVLCIALFYSYNSQILLDSTTEELPYHEATCASYLNSLKEFTRIDGILIDIGFLKKLEEKNGNCNTGPPVKIAVKTGKLKDTYKSTLNLILYEDDQHKDYWLFFDNGTIRAVPRMPLYAIGNLLIPKDPILFIEYWNRSKLLNCLNINMNRTTKASFLPIPYTFSNMAKLRDLLVEFGMYPFIIGGTLLGWYRECSLIPHTMDVDFAVFSNQVNPKFEETVLQNKTVFRFKRRLGTIEDGFEYTLSPRNQTRPAIDIFFMYQDKNESWVGGTASGGRKYRYYYPRYNPYCTADLGGHLFWVTCTPDDMLKADYGLQWRKDWPTRSYAWSSSGKNIRSGGKWNVKELKEVYRTY